MLCLLWLVGCSTPTTTQRQSVQLAQNIPQDFWVGHAFNNSKRDVGMGDTIGVCQKTKEGSSAIEVVTAPINALLKVVTLGIYTPQENGETCP